MNYVHLGVRGMIDFLVRRVAVHSVSLSKNSDGQCTSYDMSDNIHAQRFIINMVYMC